MPTFLDDVIADLQTVRSTLSNELQVIGSAVYNAGSNLSSHNYSAAGEYLKTAGNGLSDIRLPLIMLTSSFLWNCRLGFIAIRDNWPSEAGAIDMSAIINAMLLANPDEVTYFIGLTDAFRKSIWNRPYNRDFYAALARGFEQWE